MFFDFVQSKQLAIEFKNPIELMAKQIDADDNRLSHDFLPGGNDSDAILPVLFLLG